MSKRIPVDCSEPSCAGRFHWARTQAGKSMPVDAGSAGDPDGNLAVWDHHGDLCCRVLTAGEQPRSWEFRGVNHWATCTKASEFKPVAGWQLSQRHLRWEYRDPADVSRVVVWYHVARVAELLDEHGWADAQLIMCAGYGIPDLPDEAKGAQL